MTLTLVIHKNHLGERIYQLNVIGYNSLRQVHSLLFPIQKPKITCSADLSTTKSCEV